MDLHNSHVLGMILNESQAPRLDVGFPSVQALDFFLVNHVQVLFQRLYTKLSINSVWWSNGPVAVDLESNYYC